jgi:hypothetical protein
MPQLVRKRKNMGGCNKASSQTHPVLRTPFSMKNREGKGKMQRPE